MSVLIFRLTDWFIFLVIAGALQIPLKPIRRFLRRPRVLMRRNLLLYRRFAGWSIMLLSMLIALAFSAVGVIVGQPWTISWTARAMAAATLCLLAVPCSTARFNTDPELKATRTIFVLVAAACLCWLSFGF